MKEGAPPHFVSTVWEFLNSTNAQDKVDQQRGPDLISFDFCLWEHPKSPVYVTAVNADARACINVCRINSS
jgi:hypothetical protein